MLLEVLERLAAIQNQVGALSDTVKRAGDACRGRGRYVVIGLNVFSKALLRHEKSYGGMEAHNALFKNVMRYRYLSKAL